MHLPTSLTADATTPQSMAETVQVNDHRVLSFRHLSHRVGFQAKLLSDKCLDEHLESDPFVVEPGQHNNEIGQRCSFHHGLPTTPSIYGPSASITLFGQEPKT